MYTPTLIGTASRVTVTGVSAITSANANIIGALCCGLATTTGGFTLYAGAVTTTSGGTAISPTIVFASGSAAQYLTLPMYASGGFAVAVGAASSPDFTLFWNPA
jgi:hypothetical protein